MFEQRFLTLPRSGLLLQNGPVFDELRTDLNPVVLALLGGAFAWALTVLGASAALLFKRASRKFLDGILGFAAGVMIAASFWSLLDPAIEIARQLGLPAWLPASVGFILGAMCLRGLDMVLPHLHPEAPLESAEGIIKTRWKSSTLLVVAITLHNIPEGLAIGVGFGAHGADPDAVSLAAAATLAVGIGIQDIPEGFAVSMPLRRAGLSPWASFLFGVLSGVFEPLFAVVGALVVGLSTQILPYALGFAAGAMVFVTVEELIPESQCNGNSDVATAGVVLGFTAMMVLDVAFK